VNESALPLSDRMIEHVARRFRLLGEPMRLRILQVLESGEHSVNDLAAKLGTSQPNVSRHLHAMYDGGLLGRRRDGTSIFYSIGDPMVLRLCSLVCEGQRAEPVTIQSPVR
jgi:DNA-binding transcriptional ArsR family regulator